MKNFVPLLFLIALMVSGCTQDDMLRNGTSASGGRKFTASFEQDDSRTYVEDGRFYRWTEGDLVSLFDASTLNGQYMFDGETGDREGTFSLVSKAEGTGTALSANYAVYPYSEDVKISGEGEIRVTLPSEQHYAENSFGQEDNTMVAVTKDVDDTFLNFKNVGGCIKLQLYGDDVTVKSITLRGNNGEKIAGQATLSVAYDEAPSVTMAEDADTYIKLVCGEEGVKIGTSAEKATAFWMVVPPTTFEKGITVIVIDEENKVFTQTTEKQLVIGRNVVKPMAAVEAVMSDNMEELIAAIPEEDLNGWDEGLLLNDEFFFVTTKDSVGGTLAYFNKLDEDFEEGLLVEYDSDGVITHIHDHEYVHMLDFTEDSLFVTSFPADTLSSLPVKYLNIALYENDDYQVYAMSRGKKVIDAVERFYFVYSTAKRAGISSEPAWEKIKECIVDEVLQSALSRGVYYLAGSIPAAIFSGVMLAYDKVKLDREMAIYAIFGHARLCIGGPELNPQSFGLEIKNFNTLPSTSDIGKPLEYEYGVLLHGFTFWGPYSFTQGEAVELGVYDMEKLPEGEYTLIPYIRSKDYPMRVEGEPYNFMVYEPEYSVETISANEDGDDIVFVLDVSWTPVQSQSILIASQGLSFVNGENETKVCPDLTDNGEDGPIHTQVEGRLSKEYFTWNQSKTSGTAVIRIDYWLKPFDLFGEEYNSRLGYHEIEYNYTADDLRKALVKLYQSTNGDNWKRNDNWCSDKPITEWYGVKIQGGKCEIDLGHNNLTGKIDQTFPEGVIGISVSENELTSINISGSKYLESLYCDNNQLLSLDVSGCTSLKGLSCSENQLTSLDVFGYTSLIVLSCSENQLTSLDVSGCTSLVVLSCSDNQLTSLNVSGFSALVDLKCSNNQLVNIDVSDCPLLEEFDFSNNPAVNLKASGCMGFDEIFYSTGISFDKDGERIFSSSDVELASLDVSNNTSLRDLSCDGSEFTRLNVTGCSSLVELKCHDSGITNLDVSSCSSLEYLYCYDNPHLTSLNASGCSALVILECSDNNLTNLDVTGCTALSDLRCSRNSLTSLDVLNCTNLTELVCFDNPLTSLNLSGCTSLQGFSCSDQKLTSLNLSGCTSLEHLDFSYGELISLNVSGCTSLKGLSCHYNKLTSLNLTGCTALMSLDCSDNSFTTLDVLCCTNLSSLNCEDNPLTSLNLSGLTAISFIKYPDELTTLNLSGCTSLEHLDCSSGELISLNVSGCTSLIKLSCDFNKLTSLDVSGCTSLYELHCENNELTSLNLSDCTKLNVLHCYDNNITSVIPKWFSQLYSFLHDEKYTYWSEKVDGEYVTKYKDNGVGWWYPGEPGKGIHSPN